MTTWMPTLWRRPVLLAALLAGLTLCLYWPATHNGFVNYDDDQYLSADGRVARGLSMDNVSWAFTTTAVSNWHPLTWLSYMLDAELFGVNARAFHATNVILHAANVALLFWLLQRTTGAMAPSLCVAALFAVHPLNVQSVAWVAERKNVLSTFFWLLTMLAYADWARRPRPAAYAGVVLGLALSLLAKPMAVTLPFVLLLFDYWPLDRWRLGQRRLWLEKAPLFTMVAALSVVTYEVQRASGSVIATASISASDRAGNAVWSYVAYLGKAVWPTRLVVFSPYAPGGVPVWRVAVATLLVVAVTVVLVRFREQVRPLVVGWFWYLGTLVPVIGLVQVGAQAMADRYAYVPLIGIFIAVAWGGAALVRRGLLPVDGAAVVAVAGVLVLSLRTVLQTALWHDSVRLFEHTVRVEPAAWVAHYNLGNAYEARGKHEAAAAKFRDTIRWQPSFARAHNGLGNALAALNRPAEAIASYERAIELRPDEVEAYNNLGITYAAQGQAEAAIAVLRTATRVRPDLIEARINLTIALRNLGRLSESLTEADAAVALQPENALARYHRGITLVRTGDVAAARRDLAALQTVASPLAARLQAALDQRDPKS
jgi:Flp pilus assembly protein TadD